METMANDPEADGWYRDRPARTFAQWKEWQKIWSTKYDFTTLVRPRPKIRRRSKFIETEFLWKRCWYHARGQCRQEREVEELRRSAGNVDEKANNVRIFSATKRRRRKKKPTKIQIFVKTPLNSVETLNVKPDASIEELKDLLANRLGIRKELQSLYTGQLKMSDLLSLRDHGITNESNIVLKIGPGLLGGADEPKKESQTTQYRRVTYRQIQSHGTKEDPSNTVALNRVFHDPVLVTECLSSIEDQKSMSLYESEVRLAENSKQAGLVFHRETPSDGNCFYHAVSDQLSVLGLPSQSATQLRQSVVTFLRENRTVQGSEGIVDLSATKPDWKLYCDTMSKDKEWADAIVVVAMAHMLQRDILIVTSSPQSIGDKAYHWIVGDSNRSDKIPIKLGHVWEFHYRSLKDEDRIDRVVSEADCYNVIKILTPDELEELYTQLPGITYVDVKNEKRYAATQDSKLQARYVLRKWVKTNSKNATRDVIIHALVSFKFLHAAEKLAKMWAIPLDGCNFPNQSPQGVQSQTDTHETDNQLASETDYNKVVDSLTPDQLTRFFGRLPGMTIHDIEHAITSAATADTRVQAKHVLRKWAMINGTKATRHALTEMLNKSVEEEAILKTSDIFIDDHQSSGNLRSSIETKAHPDFDLHSVRQQLMQEYRETRGKLPLLPGMPEEFANMEDIFVDLEVVQEDKKPAEVVKKELKTYGDIVCIEPKKEYATRGVKSKTNGEGKDFVKRVLIRGKPGAGKTTTMSKLAYDWACNKHDSPMSKFELVFVITINEIDSNTDLISIIQDQLLPDVSGESLRAYLQSNARSVAILFDGYDEATEHFGRCKSVTNLLCSKSLSEACVIVTTRPNLVDKFSTKYVPYVQVEVKGFSLDGKKKYVEKFLKSTIMQTKHQNDDELFDHIRKVPSLTALSTIPIILSMLCLLWTAQKKLPTSITSLYSEVLLHLAKHKFAKTTDDDLDDSVVQDWVDNILFHIGERALIGLLGDKLVFKANEFDSQHLEDGCLLGVVIAERKRSGMKVLKKVSFLHKTFQELCAALYWGKIATSDRDKFNTYLLQITKENVFEMEYFLRFTCGLSAPAAEVNLPHVVQLMVAIGEHSSHTKMTKCHTIHQNQALQLPLHMLYEAEVNTEEEICINLHALTRPLYGRICIENDLLSGEFGEVLRHFLIPSKTLRDTGVWTRVKGNIWLNDVLALGIHIPDHVAAASYFSMVIPYDKPSSGPTFQKRREERYNPLSKVHLLCSRLSTLSVIGREYESCTFPDVVPYLKNLIASHFSPSSLLEIVFHQVCCDAGIFAEFLFSLPSLSKLCLYDMDISGTFPAATSFIRLHTLSLGGQLTIQHNEGFTQIISCRTFRELIIHELDSDVRNTFLQILNEYEEFVESMTRQCPACHMPIYSDCIIPLEFLSIGIDSKKFILQKLGKLITYMPHLKRLNFMGRFYGMIDNTPEWGTLFDTLSQSLHQKKEHKCEADASQYCHSSISSDPPTSNIIHTTQFEELHVSGNKLGGALKHFVYAYDSVSNLKSLKLNGTGLNPDDCEIIFQGMVRHGNDGLALEVFSLCSSYTNDPQRHEKLGNMRFAKIAPHDQTGYFNNRIGRSAHKLAQALMYTTCLKSLSLANTGLEPSDCAVLFEGFRAAGARIGCGLQLETLDLAENSIGDSVSNFVEAYNYMSKLNSLDIHATRLNKSHITLLFDGFIAIGQMSNAHRPTEGTDTQTVKHTLSTDGLKLETLDLSRNDGLRDSVNELCGAIKCMPQLKELDVSMTFYHDDVSKEKESDMIKDVLMQSNTNYKEGTFVLHAESKTRLLRKPRRNVGVGSLRPDSQFPTFSTIPTMGRTRLRKSQWR